MTYPEMVEFIQTNCERLCRWRDPARGSYCEGYLAAIQTVVPASQPNYSSDRLCVLGCEMSGALPDPNLGTNYNVIRRPTGPWRWCDLNTVEFLDFGAKWQRLGITRGLERLAKVEAELAGGGR